MLYHDSQKSRDCKHIETKTYKGIYPTVYTTGLKLPFATSVDILQVPLAFTKGQFGPSMSAQKEFSTGMLPDVTTSGAVGMEKGSSGTVGWQGCPDHRIIKCLGLEETLKIM